MGPFIQAAFSCAYCIHLCESDTSILWFFSIPYSYNRCSGNQPYKLNPTTRTIMWHNSLVLVWIKKTTLQRRRCCVKWTKWKGMAQISETTIHTDIYWNLDWMHRRLKYPVLLPTCLVAYTNATSKIRMPHVSCLVSEFKEIGVILSFLKVDYGNENPKLTS